MHFGHFPLKDTMVCLVRTIQQQKHRTDYVKVLRHQQIKRVAFGDGLLCDVLNPDTRGSVNETEHDIDHKDILKMMGLATIVSFIYIFTIFLH